VFFFFFRLIVKEAVTSNGTCVDVSLYKEDPPAPLNGSTKATVKIAKTKPATFQHPINKLKFCDSNKLETFCSMRGTMEGQDKKPRGACFGFLIDEGDAPHALYGCDDDNYQPTSNTVPLSTLLADAKVLGTQAPRIRLALKLVSAFIQFHGLSWLPQALDSDHVYILPGSTGREAQPFLSTAFLQARKPAESPPANDVAFELAKILIEIGYSNLFLNIQTPGTPGRVVTDLEKMKKLVKGPGLRMGESYKLALDNCTRWCELDIAKRDLSDEKICDKFFEDVVSPLIAGHIKHQKSWPRILM